MARYIGIRGHGRGSIRAERNESITATLGDVGPHSLAEAAGNSHTTPSSKDVERLCNYTVVEGGPHTFFFNWTYTVDPTPPGATATITPVTKEHRVSGVWRRPDVHVPMGPFTVSSTGWLDIDDSEVDQILVDEVIVKARLAGFEGNIIRRWRWKCSSARFASRAQDRIEIEPFSAAIAEWLIQLPAITFPGSALTLGAFRLLYDEQHADVCLRTGPTTRNQAPADRESDRRQTVALEQLTVQAAAQAQQLTEFQKQQADVNNQNVRQVKRLTNTFFKLVATQHQNSVALYTHGETTRAFDRSLAPMDARIAKWVDALDKIEMDLSATNLKRGEPKSLTAQRAQIIAKISTLEEEKADFVSRHAPAPLQLAAPTLPSPAATTGRHVRRRLLGPQVSPLDTMALLTNLTDYQPAYSRRRTY